MDELNGELQIKEFDESFKTSFKIVLGKSISFGDRDTLVRFWHWAIPHIEKYKDVDAKKLVEVITTKELELSERLAHLKYISDSGMRGGHTIAVVLAAQQEFNDLDAKYTNILKQMETLISGAFMGTEVAQFNVSPSFLKAIPRDLTTGEQEFIEGADE